MRKFLVFQVILLCVAHSFSTLASEKPSSDKAPKTAVLAESSTSSPAPIAPSEPREKVQKPLPLVELKSKLPTADSAFATMMVSHPYKNTVSSKIKTGIELHRYHVAELHALADGTHPLVPKDLPKGTRIRKVFAYYGFGAPELVGAVLYAKQHGVEIEITTDLNRSLLGNFEGKTTSVDFESALLRGSETGKGLATLIQNGFRVIGPSEAAQGNPYQISSQPLFNEGLVEMAPIYHLKESFTIAVLPDGREQLLYMTSGTANMNEGSPRFNRMFVLTDPDIMNYSYAHYKVVKDTFAKGGAIKDVPPTAPIRVEYLDKTDIKYGYTDGRFYLHQWHIDHMDEAVASPEELQILNHTISEFVLTSRDIVDAIERALLAFPEMNVGGGVDQKFLSGKSFGLSRLLKGLFGYRKFGKPMAPVNFNARMRKVTLPDGSISYEERVKFKTWVRAANGHVVLDLDGTPYAIELWHDKTRVTEMRVREKGQWLVSTGSFNASNNVRNMEVLLTGRFKEDSWVARGIKESIEGVLENFDKFALDGLDGYFFDDLGRFLGVGFYSLRVEQARTLAEFLRNQEFEKARGYLLAMGGGITTLDTKLYSESLSERVNRLISFLDWIRSKTDLAGFQSKVNERTLPALFEVFYNPDLSASQIKHILGGLLWNLSKKTYDRENPEERQKIQAETDERVKEAWKILNIKQDFDYNPDLVKVPEKPKKGFHALHVSIFDMDDILFHLDTKIIVYSADGKTKKEVSTAEFAKLRQSKAEMQKWKVDTASPDGGSFKNFRDSQEGESPFVTDLVKALAVGAESLGPAIKDYEAAVSTEEGANWTFVVTGRGAKGISLQKGLDKYGEWRLSGGKKSPFYQVPVENMFPVSNPDFMQNPETKQKMEQEEAKAYYIFRILAKASDFAVANPSRGKPIVTFIDDDAGNVSKFLKAMLEEGYKEGAFRFRNLKIYVKRIANGKLSTYEILNTGIVYKERELEGEEYEADNQSLGVTLREVINGKPIGLTEDQRAVQFAQFCEKMLSVSPAGK